ncbi:TPA: hypothetical protein GDO54_018498 [Pyxicephalus adspersus]|uniref:Period circadian protein homolog PER 1-3 bHLH-like domain-containing protein n=1 Tax=Pyxicephalus adspersus TaxID=30357 RepID=A0AAV2ZJJ6_PYXAD|nr:TPA: hypothetical protein GDO54_018498 [Pyxicephalus adspersus]
MPNQSKDFQQDLSLQGHHIPTKTQLELPTGVQLQSAGFLTGQHHVSSDIFTTSLYLRQGESVLQRYNTSHVSPSQGLMPGLPESGGLVDPLLVEAANVSLPKPEDHASNKGSTTNETSATGRNCMSFQTGDSQQQYGSYKTNPTLIPLQAKDLQSHHQPEDPSSISPDDMEMGNDSSSNELDENGKEPELKSGSSFQPPPCSSSAFSLMMADSEHNPSTSGYSSEQPAKAKTQKELLKILKELRSCLPPEKSFRGKSSTAASLRYALHCIQQVKGNVHIL